MKLTVGETYEVEVVKILSYGAIVKMSDNSTQLLHISNISEKFVRDVGDFVSVGSKIKVDCIAGKVKPEEISIKAYTKDFDPYRKKKHNKNSNQENKT